MHGHCFLSRYPFGIHRIPEKNVQAISVDPFDSRRVVSVPDYVQELHPIPVRNIQLWRGVATAGRSERGRRTLNVLVAIFGLIVTMPLMLVTAILVKLTSRGPVFYKQPRVGVDRRAYGEPAGNSRRKVDHGGRVFTIYKFRTMYAHGPRAHNNGEVWASPDDVRTTPIGRVLRKYRIDELPQLVNVLKGEMNVVGPRPEQPGIFRNLRSEIDGYTMRQQVLPGITGLAQITLTYDSCVEDVRRKLMMDIKYLRRRSAKEDARIMLKTIPVLMFRRGGW